MTDGNAARIPAARPGVGLALALLWAYFSAVFLVGEPLLSVNIGLWLWLASILIVLIAGNCVARIAVRGNKVSNQQLANLSLFAGTLVLGLLALDIAYSMYINSTTSSFDVMKSRVFDKNVWVSELYPEIYYPTEKNFALHKPNVTVSGRPFGNFYSAPMRSSPTLTGSVLEKYPITIRINELGFRESSDIDSAGIFALGDSFTFGWGVNEQESWPELLEARLGQPVYNLGIHDASPRQELEVLRHVLRRHGDDLHIKRLLWMIYEGNDLEDDYTEEVQRQDVPATVPLTSGTPIEAIEGLMWTIKRQSVIDRFRSGRIAWKTSTGSDAPNPYRVDGVSLVYPLYYSKRFGPRLFSGTYIDLVGKPVSYVENHWNRPALESVFQDMKVLADEYGFEVAVIMAPTACRLHGPYFDNFPEISERPWFLDFVEDLSEAANFSTVDLYEQMKPYGGSELFYFRDDDHFNRRGNEVAAELIEQELFTKSD